jgi:hypothetical protein
MKLIGMFKKPKPFTEPIIEEEPEERPLSRAKSSLYSNDETSDVLRYTNGRTDNSEIDKLIALHKAEELEASQKVGKVDKKRNKENKKSNISSLKNAKEGNISGKIDARISEEPVVIKTNNHRVKSGDIIDKEETLTDNATTLVSNSGKVNNESDNNETDGLTLSSPIIEPLLLDKVPSNGSQPSSRVQITSRNKDKNNSIDAIVNSNNNGTRTSRKNQIIEEKIPEKPKTNRYIPLDSFIKKSEVNGILFDFNQLHKSKKVKSSHKAQRVNEYIEQTFGKKILLVRQVAFIIDKFEKLGSIVKLEFFSTHRVDMIINLFDRIIDIQNFDIILRLLNPFEKACLYCRLGWLILFNPLRPDNCYELNLSRFEERRVLKILLLLQFKDFDNVSCVPDGNWIEKEFKWRRNIDKIENWVIPDEWKTEIGIPRRGIVFINYSSALLSVLQKEKELEIAAKIEKEANEVKEIDTTSEEVKDGYQTSPLSVAVIDGVKGENEEVIFNECKPNILLRKSLCNLTLINEQDYVTEKERILLLSKITDRVKNDEDIVIDEFGNIMILIPDNLPGREFMISNIGNYAIVIYIYIIIIIINYVIQFYRIM